MTAERTAKEVLGGPDGTARCRCGRLRYPRYKLCPKCYYKRTSSFPKSPEIVTCRTPKDANCKTDATVRPAGADPVFGETVWDTIPGARHPLHEELAIVCAI